jgi:hypothetical protein
VEAKWACKVAAAGRHHMLFHGPPRIGKTIRALRVPGLLPELVLHDAMRSRSAISPWVPSDHTQPAALAGTRSCSRRATSPIPSPPRGCLALDLSTPFLVPIEPIGIGCYFERDIVYTLQKRLVAQIDAECAQFRVYNDYPIIPGSVGLVRSAARSPREPVQLLGVSADHRSSPHAVVLVLAHRLAERLGADLQLPGRIGIVRPSEDRYRGSFHSS